MPKRFFIDAGSVQSLKRAIAEFPPAFFIQASGEFLDALGPLKEQMVKRSSNPPGPIPEGGGVHKKTGKLAGSWGVAVSGSSLADLKGAAFSFAATKAPRLEFGGQVAAPGGTGPTGGWIFIPTDLNKDSTGQQISSPGDVLAAGGRFANRRRGRDGLLPPAIIDGKASPAWNLLLSPFAYIEGQAAFIMAKSATYRPQLGFFDAGSRFAEILPGSLANAAVKYWREAAI
jgi:hypothetical protein